jgi:hypothetical protein
MAGRCDAMGSNPPNRFGRLDVELGAADTAKTLLSYGEGIFEMMARHMNAWDFQARKFGCGARRPSAAV